MSAVKLEPWLDKLENLIDLEHVRRTSDLQQQ
jgi:hypothetical protein